MILRKSLSVFLYTLRSLPSDQLPALPEKKLTKRQMKRLEDAVFARIAAEENRTVFSAEPDAVTGRTTAQEMADAAADSPYTVEPVGGRYAWKKAVSAVLAACVCFAILITGILYRYDIAMYLGGYSWVSDTDAVTGHEDTQAVHVWTPDEEMLAQPPENASDAYHMQVTDYTAEEDALILQVRLSSSDGTRFEGYAIQYSHITLELWDPNVRKWLLKYDYPFSYQPTAQIAAGDLHFDILGRGAVLEAETTLTLPMDMTDYQGVWRVTLDGLALVRDALPGESSHFGLVEEPFGDGVVWALFSSEEAPASTERADAQTLPPRDTVTPPPQSAYPPNDLSGEYTLSVTDTWIQNDTVKLNMRLESKNELPLGHQIFYQTCEIELWNHEKQAWERKFGTDDSDVDFAKRLMAGDGEMQFWLGTQFEPAEAATAEISYPLPDDGWYRITLRGLVLVRDAQEHSVTPYQLVSEVIEEKGVYAVFYKDYDSTVPPAASHRPPLASEDYALLLSKTKVKDDTVTLELVLQTPTGKPDGYAIYYETCEIELWNHEKQVWEGKFGTDSVDVPFEKMLLAGDVQFVVDRYSENTYASLSYDLPHDGWYRLTLSGLVLVREARGGEEAEYNLVTEVLDEGAVWVVFYKE